MGRGNGSQKPDARGGTYFLLPHCLVRSEAWRTASPRAIKALFAIWGRHTGFNNGSIAIGFRELAEGMDSQTHRANIAAVGELLARGIIAIGNEHPKHKRLAREYRLTFMPTAAAPATHEYLVWRVGDAGTRRKPTPGNKGKIGLEETTTETSVSAAESTTAAKLSAVETTTRKHSPSGEVGQIDADPVAVTATHIRNHLGGSPGRLKRDGSQSAGPISEKTGAVLSAAPSPAELRARALGFIARAGRGAQGILGREARVPGGTLSKFLHCDGPLADRARVRLACALPKLETARRTGVAA